VALLAKILANNLNLFAIHTNLDASPHGHAAALAGHLALTGIAPLKVTVNQTAKEMAHGARPLTFPEPGVGIGRVGGIAPISVREVAQRLKAFYGVDALQIAGSPEAVVARVAVCPGAAGDLLSEAIGAGAGLFIGGEFSHHDALMAAGHKLILIDGGHFATERLTVDLLCRACGELADARGVRVLASGVEKNPFTFC
jgi:putative NIF3 family GTP cyclohydrolase 1 type 2